jgi:hypothetical protein
VPYLVEKYEKNAVASDKWLFCNLSELYDSIYVISDDSKSVTHEAEIVSACDLHCYVVTVTVHQIFSSSINYATFN